MTEKNEVGTPLTDDAKKFVNDLWNEIEKGDINIDKNHLRYTEDRLNEGLPR